MAESQGFEPWVRDYRTHDFQSCAFDHSANSPYISIFIAPHRAFLSATIFIIAHISSFVKTFFNYFCKNFPRDYKPSRAAKNSIGTRTRPPPSAIAVHSSTAPRYRAKASQ